MIENNPPTAVPYEPLAVIDSIGESYSTERQHDINSSQFQNEVRTERFRDTLCSCWNNLFPSCFCAFFCWDGIYLIAQMAKKTKFGEFKQIMLLYLLLLFFGSVVFPAIFGLLPVLFAWGVGIMLRLHIIRQQQIHSLPLCNCIGCSCECCNYDCCEKYMLGEVCRGLCCHPCSIAQLARHVYGYKQIFDGDADPYRSDHYIDTAESHHDIEMT